MIRSFADAAAEDLFHGRSTKAARRFPPALWPGIQRKLDRVNPAADLPFLAAPPANGLERRKGDQKGRYSIRINDQYRVTFRFEKENAYEVRVEDYHS